MPATAALSASRPRVEGDREREILAAALGVLAEVGYDRMTMDAVALAARASKATLYRRWQSKSAMVIDALLRHGQPETLPDTGSLRGDLMAMYCHEGGLAADNAFAVFTSVITAISRDEEFAAVFRREFLGPKNATMRSLLERARARGEVADGADLDLLATVIPAVAIFQSIGDGAHPGPDVVSRVIDRLLLPAAACRGGCHRPTAQKAHS
ncbi:MAG: TetR/AcrR family transcriptional regulator [Dermatophilaceae bacterium]